MATIVTRAGKGSALSWAEADANFTNLNTDKLEQAQVNTTVNASKVWTRTAATGDGATDDASVIQAELTALGTAGGGVLYCPEGNYIIGSFLSVPADVTIQGDGMGSTIFTHKTGLTGVGNLFYASGNKAKFKDFTVVGNSAGNSGFAFSEISVNAKTEVQIIGVEILDWCRVAIDGLGTDCLIQNCRIIGNGATAINGSGEQVNSTYGIWSAGAAGRLRIIGNTIRDTAYGPIFCGGRTVIVGNNITGGHWSYSPTGGGQIADGAAGCVIASGNYVGPGGGTVTSAFELNNESIITGNYIENQAFVGVVLQDSNGAGHNINGNLIKRTGITGGVADSYGIAVNPNVNDFVIANNTIVDDAGTPTMDYGIYVLAGTSDRYAITGNKIRNAQTADLLDLGTGTVKEVQGNVVTMAKGVVGTDGTSLNANAAGTTVAAGATSYVGIGAGSSFSATENLREQVVSRAGRLSRLSVKTTGAQPGGGSLVVTLRVNGVDTGLTVTFAPGAAAGTQVDSTHTALVAAGDLISLKFVNNDGGAASATVGAFGCLLS